MTQQSQERKDVSIVTCRRFFAEWLAANSGAPDQRLERAFGELRREDFLGPGPWLVAAGRRYITTPTADPRWLYQDILVALDAEARINNGQPSLHARCLVALGVAPGDTVVHIGAGTGYYTAVLARLTGDHGEVLALEIDPALAERAQTYLSSFANVQLRCASATACSVPACDSMYVSAGVTEIPGAWLDALKPGARLVVPLTTLDGVGVMLRVVRESQHAYSARALEQVGFTPCIGTGDARTSQALAVALESTPWQRIRSLRRTGAADSTAWCRGQGWWLSIDPC